MSKEKFPMKIIVPIIIVTWILSLVSALAIASTGVIGQGPQGEQGEQGAAGPAGPQGAQGPAGPAGSTGPTGSTGPAGSAGPAGADGADGADGATWWNGTGTPSSDLGSDGDFYLDLSSSDVYNKVSGSWTQVANIQGPPGDSGPLEVLAAGYVMSNGMVNTGYNIASVTWNSVSSRYEISITGVSYYYNDYITIITAGQNYYIARTGSASGNLLVWIFDVDGNLVQGDFQFVTYRVR